MLAGRCRYHPARDAIGVCMRCGAAICGLCTTRLEGVNHCRECLDALRRGTGVRGGGAASGVLRALTAVGLYGAIFALVLALDALVRSSR